MGLEKTGSKVVVEDAAKAVQQIVEIAKAYAQMDKEQGNVAKSAKAMTKASSKTESALSKFGKQAQSFNGEVSRMAGKVGVAVPNVAMLGTALTSLVNPATIAAAAVASLAVGAVGIGILAKRGLALQPTVNSFVMIAGGADQAGVAMNNLRKDTRGLITDLELMRLTNQALQGTTKQFRDVVANDLGKVIDVTNRAAAATGQNAEIVREKFILGLRRQSKLLLDDVGVTVDATEANNLYAESIGKSAAALTDQEKQAAFAAEAIRQLDEVGKTLGDSGDTMAKLQAPLVAFQNLIDKLSLAALPVLEPVATLFHQIGQDITALATVAMPFAVEGFKLLGNIMQFVFETPQILLQAIYGDVFRLAGAALPYLIAVLGMVQRAMGAVVNSARASVQAIAGIIDKVMPNIFSNVATNIDQVAYNMAVGGANIAGSLAAGLLQGGTKVVDAAAQIAKAIADFLVGQSPPPKGALSNIDTGGYKVAMAWLDGFQQGILDNIERSVNVVNDRLGEIGKFSKEDVEKALKGLDKALLPFQENLDLVKADMEAMAGFVDPALKSLERQRQRMLKMFEQGQVSAAQIREFDKQIGQLNTLKSVEQDRLDQANIALAMGQAQQAQERALLNIQKRRLEFVDDATKDVVDATKAAVAAGAGGGVGAGAGAKTPKKPKAPKVPKGGGGEPLPLEDAGGGGLPSPGVGKDFLDDFLSSEAVDKATAVINKGLKDGLAGSGFVEAQAEFQGSLDKLKTQTDRIKEADPVAALGEKFDGLQDSINEKLEPAKEVIESFKDTAKSAFGTVGTAASSLGGLINGAFTVVEGAISKVFGGDGVSSTVSTLGTTLTTLQSDIQTFASGISTDLTPVTTAFNSVFGEEGIGNLLSGFTGDEGSLTNFQTGISDLNTSVSETLGEGGTISEAIGSFAKMIGAESPIVEAINGLVGEEGAFATLPAKVNTKLTALKNVVLTRSNLITQTIQDKLVNITLGKFLAVQGFIDDLIDYFDIDSDITTALSGLGSILQTSLVDVMAGAFQSVVDAAENIINSAYNSLPSYIKAAVDGLTGNAFPIDLGTVTGAATGALAQRGMTLVGERGPELINVKRPSTIFPNRATEAILSGQAFSGMMGNTTNNTTNTATTNNNFTLRNARDMKLQMRLENAF